MMHSGWTRFMGWTGIKTQKLQRVDVRRVIAK